MKQPYPTAGEAFKAAQLLGLELNGLLLPAVVASYRAKAKGCHPDGATPDVHLFTRTKWARDLLERYLQGPIAKTRTPVRVCEACSGLGYIKKQSGLKLRCVLCNGKG